MAKAQEIQKKEATPLAMVEKPAWMGASLSTDRKVPRLLLMQAVSDFVKEEKAQPGTVVRSTTGEKVGGMGQPIPMIILSYPKHEWIIEIKPPGKKKFEFVKTVPRTPKNQDQRWKYFADENGEEVPEGTKGAMEANRVRVGSFFALLPGDLDRFAAELEKAKNGEMPDLSVEMTPVQIRMRSFSYDASINIEKMLQKIASFGREPWQFILDLSVHEMKNDEDMWYVYEFETRQKGTPTPDKYKDTASGAFKFIQENSDKLVIDDVEQTNDTTSEGTAAPTGERKF